MGKTRLIDQAFEALPFVYVGGGLLAMLAVQNKLAVFSGLILVAVGGVELLRRARFRRDRQASESRLTSRMRPDHDGHSTQALMQISWRKSFECGHPVIDRQHRQLFETGDGLINAVLKDKAREHIEFLLDELIEHIQDHFITEEAVMARTKYPLSVQHRAHHAALLAKAQSLRDRYRNYQLELSELVGFIAYEVITDHIIKEDLKFALKERQPALA